MKALLVALALTVPLWCQDCTKNVSFAVAEGGQITARAPQFTKKWIKKNQKHYRGLCFSQSPMPNAANYSLVFSMSRSAYDGLYPTVHTYRDTSTTPVSGSGTVTDSYGRIWNYSYSGTETTTTTTTVRENVPYTDTAATYYIFAYNDNGVPVSERWWTITLRQGGDGYNTLGYNLGASLGSIHWRQRLLKAVVKDVYKH